MQSKINCFLFLIRIARHIKKINSRHNAFESIVHISYSATVNDERGKRLSIEEKINKEKIGKI